MSPDWYSTKHILVLGDLFLDEYKYGDCTRISPEAPVPILNIESVKVTLGGAGNTAANVVSLGGKCTLIGRMGLDEDGKVLKKLCAAQGIEFIPLPQGEDRLRGLAPYPTPIKTRLIGQRQQLLRIDKEVIQPMTPDCYNGALWYYRRHVADVDVVVLSDYAKGFFDLKLCQEIINEANRLMIPIVVDPKPDHTLFYKGATYLTPNTREAREMTPLPYEANMLITKGSEGMEYFGTDGSHIVRPTMAKEVFDVAGAGDTVVAAFALAIASSTPIEDAIDFANKAAGVVVGKRGTSTVTLDELESTQALEGILV